MPPGLGYSFDPQATQPQTPPESVKLLSMKIPPPRQMGMPMQPQAGGMDQLIRGLMQAFQPRPQMPQQPKMGPSAPSMGQGIQPLF